MRGVNTCLHSLHVPQHLHGKGLFFPKSSILCYTSRAYRILPCFFDVFLKAWMFSPCKKPMEIDRIRGLTKTHAHGKAQVKWESNGELPQTITCACGEIETGDITNGIHTRHWTKETTFQSTLTCFADRQLTIAYTTIILVCQLCKT